MTDMLARQRLRANLIDQIQGGQQQLGRLERGAAEPDADGLLQSPGLLLRVLDATPTAPPEGYVLLYAIKIGSTTYLRAMDDAGTEKTLDNWV